jgi:hypothetical protein
MAQAIAGAPSTSAAAAVSHEAHAALAAQHAELEAEFGDCLHAMGVCQATADAFKAALAATGFDVAALEAKVLEDAYAASSDDDDDDDEHGGDVDADGGDASGGHGGGIGGGEAGRGDADGSAHSRHDGSATSARDAGAAVFATEETTVAPLSSGVAASAAPLSAEHVGADPAGSAGSHMPEAAAAGWGGEASGWGSSTGAGFGFDAASTDLVPDAPAATEGPSAAEDAAFWDTAGSGDSTNAVPLPMATPSDTLDGWAAHSQSAGAGDHSVSSLPVVNEASAALPLADPTGANHEPFWDQAPAAGLHNAPQTVHQSTATAHSLQTWLEPAQPGTSPTVRKAERGDVASPSVVGLSNGHDHASLQQIVPPSAPVGGEQPAMNSAWGADGAGYDDSGAQDLGNAPGWDGDAAASSTQPASGAPAWGDNAGWGDDDAWGAGVDAGGSAAPGQDAWAAGTSHNELAMTDTPAEPPQPHHHNGASNGWAPTNGHASSSDAAAHAHSNGLPPPVADAWGSAAVVTADAWGNQGWSNAGDDDDDFDWGGPNNGPAWPKEPVPSTNGGEGWL